MNRLISTAVLTSVLCGTTLAQTTMPVSKAVMNDRETPRMEVLKGSLNPALFNQESSSLKANFTTLNETGSKDVVWEEGFDNGSTGWTLVNAENFSWELKQFTDDKTFTGIDPDDKQSLHIEGGYAYRFRGYASATSSDITIPKNATLSGYIGYSLAFNENCTLTLSASTDGAEWTKLWSSLDDKGEMPWAWRKFTVDMTAFTGKTVKLKFEYGNTEATDNLGYLGDFAIDGLKVEAASEVTNLDVMTGELIKLADASEGTPTSWSWNFPGGTPETSSEKYPTVYYTRDGTYDVSLTVSDGTNTSTKTIPGFVKVTGVKPTAKIATPASFRYAATRLPMIAPLAKVQFKDASAGFPTEREWMFTGLSSDATEYTTSTEENPNVSYMFQHQQSAILTVSNQHGESSDMAEVSVEYEGFVNNLQPDDLVYTFDLDGYGEFPGTNSMGITEYAEKFSKPSRPIYVSGVQVYFTNAIAEDVIDQIADIKVAICKSENGLPGEQLEFMSWRTFELETSSGSSLKATDFEFSKPVKIDDEFFIVISGIPEKNETNKISFATAKFRAEGNTAYFKQRGEWKAASDYFPAGSNHTSYAVQPYIVHSVMAPLSDDNLTVDSNAGTVEYEFFTTFSFEKSIDADWCRITNEPNGLTVDKLTVEYDKLPDGLDSRTATITITDGLSEVPFTLTQQRQGSVTAVATQEAAVYPSVFTDYFTVELPENATSISVFNSAGVKVLSQATDGATQIKVNGSGLQKGIYFVKVNYLNGTSVLKAIKQ